MVLKKKRGPKKKIALETESSEAAVPPHDYSDGESEPVVNAKQPKNTSETLQQKVSTMEALDILESDRHFRLELLKALDKISGELHVIALTLDATNEVLEGGESVPE